MTVAEIVNEAASLLEDADPVVLEQCARRSLDEVAAEYFPLVETETVPVRDRAVSYEAFSHTPFRVYAVRVKGRGVAFEPRVDRLDVEIEGRQDAEVTYAYLPGRGPEAAADRRVPCRTLAYGAAAEYCLLTGLFDDAALWDKRFRDSLTRLKKRGGRLPQRRWL